MSDLFLNMEQLCRWGHLARTDTGFREDVMESLQRKRLLASSGNRDAVGGSVNGKRFR